MEDCRRRSTKKEDEGEDEEESRKWTIHISLPFGSINGAWKECSPAGSPCSFLPYVSVMSSRKMPQTWTRNTCTNTRLMQEEKS